MAGYGRSDRVGAAMQRELSQLVRDDIKDPRLGMVTIQEVRVSRDLSHAKVYFTVMDKDSAKASAEVLNKAAGYLRRRLGDIMTLRQVPQLHFVYDTSIEEGMRLESLIDKAVKADRHEDD
jgi:ribosome-binding factor A